MKDDRQYQESAMIVLYTVVIGTLLLLTYSLFTL